MVTKPQKMRLEEAMNIRQQLQRMGALTDPQTAATVKRNLNAFVSDEPQGSSFRISLSENSSFIRVILSVKDHMQSGLTVELSR
jgi:hypothetical protein